MASAPPADARTVPDPAARLCDSAAVRAARLHDIPLDVLKAISRTETGRSGPGGLQPWPWTVNMEGRGVWFASSAETLDFVRRHVAQGARSFDVGCFQLNYRWHGTAFGSLDDMLDPDRNAAYAAGFLRRLHDEFGDWNAAAGAYHSRTPEFAARYAARFDRIRRSLDGAVADLPKAAAAADGSRREPAAPGPLITGGRTALGSLVPVSGPARGTALFTFEDRMAILAEIRH